MFPECRSVHPSFSATCLAQRLRESPLLWLLRCHPACQAVCLTAISPPMHSCSPFSEHPARDNPGANSTETPVPPLWPAYAPPAHSATHPLSFSMSKLRLAPAAFLLSLLTFAQAAWFGLPTSRFPILDAAPLNSIFMYNCFIISLSVIENPPLDLSTAL